MVLSTEPKLVNMGQSINWGSRFHLNIYICYSIYCPCISVNAFLIYDCITNYLGMLLFKTMNIYDLIVSVCQRFRHSWAGSSGVGFLMRLESRSWLGLQSSQDWERIHFQSHSRGFGQPSGSHWLWPETLVPCHLDLSMGLLTIR